ncbi:MAG: hypothetical protein ACK4VP_02085, partial [Nitrospira sp.]
MTGRPCRHRLWPAKSGAEQGQKAWASQEKIGRVLILDGSFAIECLHARTRQNGCCPRVDADELAGSNS